MMRMFSEKTFLDTDVRRFVAPPKDPNQTSDQISPEYLKIQNDLKDVLVPVQMVVTKSKDDGKGAKRYCLFCKQNLKIYDTIDQYLKDAPYINKNTAQLKRDMDQLFNASYNEYLMAENAFDDEPEEQNLVINNPIDIFKDIQRKEDSEEDFIESSLEENN